MTVGDKRFLMVVAVLMDVGAVGCGSGLRLATQLHRILRERTGFRRLRKRAGRCSLRSGLRSGRGSTSVRRTADGVAHGRVIGRAEIGLQSSRTKRSYLWSELLG